MTSSFRVRVCVCVCERDRERERVREREKAETKNRAKNFERPELRSSFFEAREKTML